MTIALSLTTTNIHRHQALYEQDYVLWLDEAVNLLRSQNFAEIDLENLIEEIEEMGGSQK